MNNRPISKLRNLGPKSEQWLNELGIMSEADLKEHGAVATYKAFCQIHGPNLNMLWSLVGALMDLSYKEVPKELKEKLLEEIS